MSLCSYLYTINANGSRMEYGKMRKVFKIQKFLRKKTRNSLNRLFQWLRIAIIEQREKNVQKVGKANVCHNTKHRFHLNWNGK